MKKIHILVIICSMFLSCENDTLDKLPLDKFSEANVWNDASLAEGFVFNIYRSVIRSLYSRQYTDDWTDEVIPNPDNGSRSIHTSGFDSNTNFGWFQYGTIRKCCLAISKLEESTTIDQNVSKQLIAESKLMRAMTYYWMARRFGGVILIDKVLTVEDELKLPRATERATYDFIINDVKAALPDLPSIAAKGRLTKSAAQAFLSMAALQIGDYDTVIEAADAVEAAGFTLDPVYKNMFNSYAGTTTSPEVIFIYHSDKDRTTFLDTRMFRNLLNGGNGPKLPADAIPQFDPSDLFEAWPQRWPSQELVDDYLFKVGGTAVKKRGIEFQGDRTGAIWANRDDRFEQSIVRDGAKYSKSIFTFRRGGNAHWTSNPLSDWGTPKGGYMFRKWMYEDQFFFNNFPVTWAEPIFRLGEVLLNKAEAYGRKGNLAKAIEYMNRTRTIHGGLPALPSGSSIADFWTFYKIERHVEMTQEDDRYWSLIRWARAENATSIPELNGKLHVMDMLPDGSVNIVEGIYSETLRFDVPRRLLFPIPDSEIRENPALTGKQNPGWQ